ncbi:MAG TPA: phosphoribosylformylglycinamidine cyclo-ligase [Chitinispirillaceae bacterium]|jgi:phosphoribosylformylglycinamidine cyclo-ligase|nr:phosphoribosylformylglycinamidine cyclo-ligase [Chitinispirillaceae bacterium]
MANPLRYSDAGVDVSAWNKAKVRIGELVSSTFNNHVVGKFGQFGGMFDLAGLSGMKNPILVSSTDSVGTKVMVAHETGVHNTVGQDIVNHCVDDILVLGARPLFFLDYIGLNKLIPEVLEGIITGLTVACKANGCVLIGGETAEMPDLYGEGEYDLVGCIVGVVDKEKIVDGSTIVPGNVLIGLRSNGLHTNGYSLARKIVKEVAGKKYSDIFEETGNTFGHELLRPHRAYTPLLPYMEKKIIRGCAHITGGGFQDNVDRILPQNCNAVITTGSWKPDPIFTWMQKEGNVEAEEMYHTFNMGIGLCIAVDQADVDVIMKAPELAGFEPTVIGAITEGAGKVVLEF